MYTPIPYKFFFLIFNWTLLELQNVSPIEWICINSIDKLLRPETPTLQEVLS